MGTCLTIVKLVGIGSLGSVCFVSSDLRYSLFPKFVNFLEYKTSDMKNKFTKLNKGLVHFLNWGIYTCYGLSAYLFSAAYTSAGRVDKHPYLLYASAGSVIGLGYHLYAGYKTGFWKGLKASIAKFDYIESGVSHNADGTTTKMEKQKQKKMKKVKKLVKQKKPEEVSSLDNSVYKDLGSTGSEEEVEVETEVETEVEVEVPVLVSNDSEAEREVKMSIVKNELESEYSELSKYFKAGQIISGSTLFIVLLGYSGEFFI